MSKKITLQDIFNAAWQAFIIEDKQPATEGGACRYLTSDNRKCAVGLCIPDGHYLQNKQMSFSALLDYDRRSDPDILLFDDQLYILNDESIDKLNNFQAKLHDHLCINDTWTYDKEERKNIYKKVAKDYNLTIPDTDKSMENIDDKTVSM